MYNILGKGLEILNHGEVLVLRVGIDSTKF